MPKITVDKSPNLCYHTRVRPIGATMKCFAVTYCLVDKNMNCMHEMTSLEADTEDEAKQKINEAFFPYEYKGLIFKNIIALEMIGVVQ